MTSNIGRVDLAVFVVGMSMWISILGRPTSRTSGMRMRVNLGAKLRHRHRSNVHDSCLSTVMPAWECSGDGGTRVYVGEVLMTTLPERGGFGVHPPACPHAHRHYDYGFYQRHDDARQ